MINRTEAMLAKNFEHTTLKGSDGKPLRCRATGQCQIWKTRPTDFKLPVKYGLYQGFYLTPANAAEWIAVGNLHQPLGPCLGQNSSIAAY